MKTCNHCREPFEETPGMAANRAYCSPRCRRAAFRVQERGRNKPIDFNEMWLGILLGETPSVSFMSTGAFTVPPGITVVADAIVPNRYTATKTQ